MLLHYSLALFSCNHLRTCFDTVPLTALTQHHLTTLLVRECLAWPYTSVTIACTVLLQVIYDHYQGHTQDLLSMKRPLEMENMHNSLLRSSNVTLLSAVTMGLQGEPKKVRSRP